MTPVSVFSGRPVAVFGLGGSGLVTAQALALGGARVFVWDDNEHAREKARSAGLRIENLAAADWRNFAALVLSHWVLDFASHRPDMPLWPGGPKVGLGLWYSLPATLVVEAVKKYGLDPTKPAPWTL